MHTPRLRSAAALLTIALLSALTGESVAWHDHPLDSRQLAPYGVSLVEHEGDFETHVHFDRGALVQRVACWACILASSPTESASSGAPVASYLALHGRMALRGVLPARSAHLRRAEARGPPAAPSPDLL